MTEHDIVLARQFALEQAVIAAGPRHDPRVLVEFAKHFAGFIDPANNKMPLTEGEMMTVAQAEMKVAMTKRASRKR